MFYDHQLMFKKKNWLFKKNSFRNSIRVSNTDLCLDPDLTQHFTGLYQDPNCSAKIIGNCVATIRDRIYTLTSMLENLSVACR